MKTMRGFTLIELMVTITILGILIGYGIPAFREMTAGNRQLTAANELISTFNHARNAAITLSRDVEIDAKNGNWGNGWTVTALAYTGTAPDGTVANYPAEVLLSHDALSGQLTLTADSVSYTYGRLGFLGIAGTEKINICDDRVAEKGHSISIEPIGRVSNKTVNCS